MSDALAVCGKTGKFEVLAFLCEPFAGDLDVRLDMAVGFVGVFTEFA
jgi:hypothetical protein